ncbi:MAG: TldD/PmbA family protein [Myxococcaceae bacterium]|nr:TldD/PmbA family protein [Myxococcaceae bacterium]
MNYQALAKKLVQRAARKGATQAEAFIQVGRESSVRVRDGAIEDLTQATSRGVGLRVIAGSRLGFAYTSDFNPATLDAFVDRALQLASAAAPNRHNGLPKKADLEGRQDVGPLFDPAVANLPADWKVKTALEIERAAKAFDPRVTTFDSVGAGDHVSEVYVASTEGLSDSYQGTYVFMYAVPVATDGHGGLQTSYWVDYKRFLDELDTPEAIGTEAARRAVRMLGAKKVKSQKVPVIFDPLMAATFVGNVAAAASGDLIFKKSSIFVGRLGKKVGASGVTIVDDGLLARGLGTSPFDGEGVPTRRTPLIEAGVLKGFLYDAFTARKAGAKSTGNASRGYASLPHIGFNNLYLERGDVSPETLIGEVKNGFYVTAMLGHGANVVTGEYSRGANGLWIRDGELAEPVQEVTVAGDLLGMLSSIDGIGSDLTLRGPVGAPTIRFSELTVSGE